MRRAELADKAHELYQLSLTESHASILEFTAHHLALGESDVVHDLLAFLAEQMIDLNKRKQAEVKRFLAWLEGRLAIIPKGGATGLASLTGKTILQNYLGDYQKDEPERTWDEFYYRLHQNRTRCHARLDDVQGEIQHAFEASLAVLRPIKRHFATTDTLIDKIVYRLYGLTDAEIEIIERPQYEQALADAKQQVVQDKTLADDEERLAALADKVLPTARRLQQRVNLAVDEAALAAALPGVEWLTDEARTFLLGAEYDLRTEPEQLDFATCVLSYAKAVEQMLGVRLFGPLPHRERRHRRRLPQRVPGQVHGRRQAAHPLRHGRHPAQRQGGRPASLRRARLRHFGGDHLRRERRGRPAGGQDPHRLRNRAAHDTVLARADALQARPWRWGFCGCCEPLACNEIVVLYSAHVYIHGHSDSR